MVEFEIEGKQFRFDKLSAMQQFHVSRKIAPLVPPLMPIFAQIKKDADGDGKKAAVDDFAVIGPLLQPFADGLAEMTDESSEYVFTTCLGSIRYQHMGNWVPMWSPTAKTAMFVELNDVSLLLRLVVRVISESLAPFIAGFVTRANEAQESSPVSP